jgi:hypothetical protein
MWTEEFFCPSLCPTTEKTKTKKGIFGSKTVDFHRDVKAIIILAEKDIIFRIHFTIFRNMI